MEQLESVVLLTSEILKEARKKLSRQLNDPSVPLLSELRGMGDCRLVCPFCLYSEKHNKTTAKIRGGFFKCFACGAKGRIE